MKTLIYTDKKNRMMEQEIIPEKGAGLDEGIDLKEVIKRIWDGRKTIYIFLAVAFVLSIVVVKLTPRQYSTQITLLTESGSKSGTGGLLGQLGGMTGINIGGLSGLMGGSSESDALTPELYPEIVKSTPFLLEVLNQKVTESKGNKTMTVAEYLERYNQSGMTRLMGLLKEQPLYVPMTKPDTKGLLKLTNRQMDLANGLAGIINLNVKSSNGGGLTGGGSKIITVTIELQDPVVSAQLADSVVGSLKHYIVDYNTGKAKKDLDFIMARFNEARDKYYLTQQALAHHNDRNLNVITASANTSKERLETENSLAANIYNSLAQVLEQSKIKVQDHTPVFSVLEPAKVPLVKSKPKSIIIMMGMMFVGALVGGLVVFFRK